MDNITLQLTVLNVSVFSLLIYELYKLSKGE